MKIKKKRNIRQVFLLVSDVPLYSCLLPYGKTSVLSTEVIVHNRTFFYAEIGKHSHNRF